MMVFVNDPKNLRTVRANPFTIARDMRVLTTAAEVEFHGTTVLRYDPYGQQIDDNEQPDHEWHVNAWMEPERGHVSYRRWEEGGLSEWRVA